MRLLSLGRFYKAVQANSNHLNMKKQDEITPSSHSHDNSVLSMVAPDDNKRSTAGSLAERTTIGDGAVSPPSTDSPVNEKTEEPTLRPTGWKWPVLMAAIISSTFLYALDGTIVAVLQPGLIEEFGHIEELSWLSVAFLLSATATNLLWGRIYANFDAKWFYIFHVFIFEVGSALCGAAPSMSILILGRVVAGLGGSGQYVGCMTLIAGMTTMEERPMYISLTGVSWGLGTVLGPVIGGAFAESSAGWRWGFYINLFVGLAAAPAWLFLIPSKDPRPGTSFRSRFAEIDYAGVILQGGVLTSLLLAVNLGGVTLPWDSGRIITTFVVSGVLLILLAIQQVRHIFTTPARRILPIQFFKSKIILILFACMAANGAVMFVPTYMIPLFFQFTRPDGPLSAGVQLLPFISLLVFFTVLNGVLMAKFGYYMPWFLAGGCLSIIGSALMYTIDAGDSKSRVYGYTVLIGMGDGMFGQAGYAVAQAVVDVADIAPAIGFITLAQFLGITLSLALANAVLLNESQSQLQRILPELSLSEIQGAILGARSEIVQRLGPETQQRVLEAIVGAIGQTYILVMTAGALVALLSLLMSREKLFQGGPVTLAMG
jgi:MFS family permease